MTTSASSRGLETTCWVLGTALLTLYCGTRAYGEFERRDAVAQFAQARAVADVEAASSTRDGEQLGRAAASAADAPPDQSSWSPGRVRAYEAALTDDDEPQRPAAVLRIESVSLEVPVYADSSERNLNRGAGLIAGTALPGSDGNVAIAAHRDGYFRALRNAAVGDIVELDSRSQDRKYRITEITVVEPTDLWPLDATGEPAITLVTCYPFYFIGSAPRRLIVRATAVD